MKSIKKQVLKELGYRKHERFEPVINLTLAKVRETHVTNEFFLKKLKEQREADMLEVREEIEKLKFKGRFKGIDEETDRAYQKGNNDALKHLLSKLRGEGE